jgi:hypothetical protein
MTRCVIVTPAHEDLEGSRHVRYDRCRVELTDLEELPR